MNHTRNATRLLNDADLDAITGGLQVMIPAASRAAGWHGEHFPAAFPAAFPAPFGGPVADPHLTAPTPTATPTATPMPTATPVATPTATPAATPTAHVDTAASSTPGFGPSAYYDAVPTHSFDIQNFGDPHVQTIIDGTVHEQIDYGPSIHDFETFNNTVGGPTAISTHTYNLSGDTHITVNHDVTISSGPVGAAPGTGWALNVDGEGHVAVTDAHGTTTIDAAGNSTLHVGNAVITTTQDHVLVHQDLQDGGHVDTVIDVHRGVNGIGGNVDFETTGQGNAGLGGWVIEDHHGDSFATYGSATFDANAVV